MRTKLGALLGAGGLLLLAASVTIAAPPTHSISVSKTASPASVPVSGATVAFTVWVTATGTGFFQAVNVSDSLGGCTVGAAVETSGDGDDKLETGETWSYSCSVANVTPGTTNTATVHACHNVSACNQAAHDAQGQGSVTVTEGAAPPTNAPPTNAPPTNAPPTNAPPTAAPPTAAPPTAAPPTAAPPTNAPPTNAPPTNAPLTAGPGTANPTLDLASETQSATDTVEEIASAAGSPRALMLVLSLGMLLASLILITPARPVRTANGSR